MYRRDEAKVSKMAKMLTVKVVNTIEEFQGSGECLLAYRMAALGRLNSQEKVNRG